MNSDAVAGQAPDPGPIWDALNGYQKTAALRAGIELDVFTAIAEGSNTAEAIATRSKASQRGVRILCDYLCVAGFLSKESERYSLTPTSAAFLNRHSPASMCSIVHFLNSPRLMSGFTDLAETVRRGTTLLNHGGTLEPESGEWEKFANSM